MPGEVPVLAHRDGAPQRAAPAQGHRGMRVREGDRLRITAQIEHGKIKKLTGVKTKELLVWVTLCDIYLDDPPTGKITFKTPSGLYRSFPVSAFEIEEPAKDGGKAKGVEGASAAVEVKEV
ncbi:hypothetical protein EUGRSUZ_H03305 [Eucalyptus grandis]|uniref:Uncharacterized protein n=2 Tax=Eucalyptus grandis TaxID=71139 RepID=A0ACC3JYQ4_EUCGR|nr:hypothetical protein EUGRSUZ_H03305 [Eucalyptus grandis]